MKKIVCRNDNGLSALFMYDHEQTEYFLESCDGIYTVKNKVNRSQNATTDGSTYNGEGLEERNIVITANIIRNYRENREYLARVFKIHSEGTFIHEENGTKREIKYRVESIEVSEIGVIRTAVISLICTDPYFTDGEEITVEMSQWYDEWEFELEIPESGIEFGHRETETIKQIDNESTRDVGLTITLEADDYVVNPTIYNQTTDETLKLLCTMEPYDIIIIKTIEGNITIELIRGGIVIDYNYTVDEDNDGYIQLQIGRNVVKYDADEGVEYLNVKLEYSNKYIFA
ncbi:phage tail domain-containing protein [Diplocloster modestus]|uniref:Phage tail family protein n=1 Tax=Diplocloster modestus TaxID=2850322 RepID=A0ABS6KCM7_9FIRM|nr:phage tail domain-containing protein [Diplocloster modestus]MBU9728266.1 phage tail family protein [Diplocloster modestus]